MSYAHVPAQSSRNIQVSAIDCPRNPSGNMQLGAGEKMKFGQGHRTRMNWKTMRYFGTLKKARHLLAEKNLTVSGFMTWPGMFSNGWQTAGMIIIEAHR